MNFVRRSENQASLGARLAVGCALLYVVALSILRPGAAASIKLALLAVTLVAAWQLCLHLPTVLSHRQRRLACVLLTFAALGSTAHLAPGTNLVFTSGFVLAFLYVGLSLPRGSSLALAPVAAAMWLVQNAPLTTLDWSRLPLTAGIWVIVSELLASHTRTNSQARELLHYAATHDPLTGLNNRRSMQSMLDELVPGDAVIFLDLDHFKKVNDLFGHATGDRILQDFGRVILSILRTRDVAVRYGGEEILVILPGAHVSGAERALRRLRDGWTVVHREVTFSAGIAIVSATGGAAAIERADAALYEAKNAGRNRWVHADTDLVPSQKEFAPSNVVGAAERSAVAVS